MKVHLGTRTVAVMTSLAWTLVLGGLTILFGTAASGCRQATRSAEVVVYTSVDEPRAEPMLRQFEESSGLRVRPVYDVEASKTTGLASRLVAEATHPRADVFWSSEVIQTAWLAERGVLAPYASPSATDVPEALRDDQWRWTGMGLRFRVILVNTHLVPEGMEPQTLRELLVDRKVVSAGMALPLFGTSFTQATVLYSRWGPERAGELYRDAVASGVHVLDGNARVATLVARGTLAAGLTDGDDARAAVARGAPLRIVVPAGLDEGGLAIPGTVAVIRGAPHPVAGHALADWLLSRAVEERLVASGYFDRSVREAPPALVPDWSAAAREVEPVRRHLEEIFLR